MLLTNRTQVSALLNMIVFFILLVTFTTAQETYLNPNDVTDTEDIPYEMEDYSGPNYPWLGYGKKQKQSQSYIETEDSSKEFSNNHIKTRSDPDGYPEENSDVLDNYDDSVLEEPTMRMASPLELLGHFLSGKKKVLNGINEGILGGKTVLDGIQEITKGLGEFLATA